MTYGLDQQNIDEYLQSDDSSSEGISDEDAELVSDDDEKDFEAHTKPKLNYEGNFEDDVSSSSS